jgi:uncharacterized protein YbaR (Trm112 family)
MMTKPRLIFDEAVLAQLACPACHGDLRMEDSRLEDLRVEDSRLTCNACARGYPTVDGIPALIIERAETTT